MKKIIIMIMSMLMIVGCTDKNRKPTQPSPTTSIDLLVEVGDQSRLLEALMTEVKNQGGLKNVAVSASDKPGFVKIQVSGDSKELQVAKAAYAALIAAIVASNEDPQGVDVEEVRRISDKLFDIYLKALQVLDLIAIISEDEGLIKLKKDIEKVGNKVILAVQAILLILEE